MYSDAYIFSNLNHVEIAKIHLWNDKILLAEKEWNLAIEDPGDEGSVKETIAHEKWKKVYKEGGVVLAEIKQAVYERLVIANRAESKALKKKD
jgi:hypothetical protein